MKPKNKLQLAVAGLEVSPIPADRRLWLLLHLVDAAIIVLKLLDSKIVSRELYRGILG